MDPLALFIIGGALLLIGVLVMASNVTNLRRRKRIIATPTSKIALAPASGVVEIAGTIVPSEQGVFQAPFSGLPAVWARLTIQERKNRGKSTILVTVLKEVYERVFLVDDGSGQQARVFPASAHLVLDATQVATSGVLREPPAHLQAFLQQKGIASKGFIFNRNLTYKEERLAPGDALYALGPAYREGGAMEGAFREGPPGALVLRAGVGVQNELLLTNKSERTLVRKLLVPFVVGACFAGAGAISVAWGLLAG